MKELWENHFGRINVKRDINLKTINLEKDISNKEDYYTTKDLLNMGFKNSFIKRIKEYVQFYKYKQRLYILKFPKFIIISKILLNTHYNSIV